MSDLHLEMTANCHHLKRIYKPVTGDVLVLAGDTLYLNAEALPLKAFWQWASENYRQVIIIPGNHEFYHQCDVVEHGMQWEKMLYPNVGIYQNRVLRIDDTDFILSALWSHIDTQYEYEIQRGLADFHQTLHHGELLTIQQPVARLLPRLYQESSGRKHSQPHRGGHPPPAHHACGCSLAQQFAVEQCFRHGTG